jgi:23S rRNA U2552 (ribose-2'-O)-methylase RlmE/FtsJ
MAGHLTPVYFGSAIKEIGVSDLLDGLVEYGPRPRAQPADTRVVEATEPGLSALVFKIQANMDPNHRDRIAFARVCSGKLVRGMRLKQVRTGKLIPLHAPQFFFARERQTADEAFAGDVVGIPNHGTLRIGDTLSEDEEINFVGVPYFAPEILRRVRLDDAMKAKKLRQALQELAEEGVVQLFRPQDGAQPIVGVVGTLQLDVLIARLAGIDPKNLRYVAFEGGGETLTAMLGGPADVVMSDMAANTTGHKKTDHLRIIHLAELAAEFAREITLPGGFFVAKVFQGGAENDLLAALKRDYAIVSHVKPKASRADSAELYVLATGFRGGTLASSE